MSNEVVGKCPFCDGTVWYTKMDKDTRTPDTIRCLGPCAFEIQTGYDEGEGKALKYFEKSITNFIGAKHDKIYI